MHPAVLPAALAFSAALAMAIYVGRHREQTELHRILVALLIALMLWTGGAVCRFTVTTQAGLEASLQLLFLGVFTVPPLWLLFAAHYARVRLLERHRNLWIPLMVPSLAAWATLLTNHGHGLMIRDLSFEAMRAGGRAWAGPAFWAFLAWAYSVLGVGVVIHLRTAACMVVNDDRRRGLLLALLAAIPVLTSANYLFQVIPASFDLTPTGLTLSLVLLSAAVFRYRLLESLPLARRDVIEHLDVGVVIANSEGAIVDLNPAAAWILGESPGNLKGRVLSRTLSLLVPEAKRAALERSLEGLEASRDAFLSEVRTEDERCVAVRAALVRDPRGSPAGRFAVLRDRTDERRTERVLHQTQRLETVGTLTAGIAHEVNNPLAFIRSNLQQMLRMGELVDEHREIVGPDAKLAEPLADLREIADETLDGIDRIERLVADMRLLSSQREEAFVATDLNRVVGDALRLADLSRERDVAIDTDLFEPLPEVSAAPQRVVQAILNLLVNAKQALAGVVAPRIEVSTRVESGFVVVAIADNGPGIAAELHSRIFDPFFTTKGPGQGTGLGLSIAYDILRDHGGALEVESRLDQGTCFSARIPAA
jgi:two-component system sensor histidine kinase HupT/HoxJ